MGNKDDKKIGSIKSTGSLKEVKGASSISEVDSVKATKGIGEVKAVGAIGGKRKPTRTMTLAEREELFRMIDSEAENMKALSPQHRELVKKAVKMAVDSGLVDDEKKEK